VLTVYVAWAGGKVLGDWAKNGRTVWAVAAPAAVGAVAANIPSGAITKAALKIPPRSVRKRFDELAIA
jgi:hypothetical protein